MKEKHRGALTELRAASWLLEQGYDVFRNISPYGEVDLVAIKDGTTRYFDVKTTYRGGSKRPGIELISPMADGSFRIMGAARPRREFRTRKETPREKIVRQLESSGFVLDT